MRTSEQTSACFFSAFLASRPKVRSFGQESQGEQGASVLAGRGARRWKAWAGDRPVQPARGGPEHAEL